MPSTASPHQIQNEFDAIAHLIPDTDRLGPGESWLLAHLPSARGTVLEIGCGVGSLSRRLTTSFKNVTAIDSSEGMIEEAKRRTPEPMSVEYVCMDIFEWLRRHPATYDCIASVATLHHVDLGSALRAMAASLKPGGRLLVVDLVGRSGWLHFFVNAAAWAATRTREMTTLRGTSTRRLRAAFEQHGRNESYLSLTEVKRAAGQELPAAQIRVQLPWRYSIIWDKSEGAL